MLLSSCSCASQVRHDIRGCDTFCRLTTICNFCDFLLAFLQQAPSERVLLLKGKNLHLFFEGLVGGGVRVLYNDFSQSDHGALL